MRLGVNGSRLLGPAAGVSRYLANLVSRWSPEVVGGRFDAVTLYAPAPVDRHSYPLPGSVRQRILPPPAPGLVWENVRLGPASDEEVLFCPSYTRPFVARGRTVVAIHDSVPKLYPHLFGRRQPLYNHLYGWSGRHATLVLTSTEAARRDIARCWDVPVSRIRVVPLAAAEAFRPLHRERPEESDTLESRPYYLFVGKTSGRRQVPLLLEAFARFLVTTGRRQRLVMVGPSPTFDLQAEVHRLGLDGAVEHRGFVPDDELNRLYNGALALVWPSVFEQVSLPLMEAQAAGTPVVCVDTAGSREVTGGAGVLLPELRADLLAGAMAQLASDRERRAELSEAGLANARRFSWDRTARETLDVLAEAGASLGTGGDAEVVGDFER